MTEQDTRSPEMALVAHALRSEAPGPHRSRRHAACGKRCSTRGDITGRAFRKAGDQLKRPINPDFTRESAALIRTLSGPGSTPRAGLRAAPCSTISR